MSSTSYEAKAPALAALLAISSLVTKARGEEVVVRNVRPLAEAIEALGKQFHLPITYEDPPYLFPGDIEDITSRVMRPEAVAHLLATGQRLPVLMGMKERELKFGYAFPANLCWTCRFRSR